MCIRDRANLGANYLVDGQFSGNIPGRMGNAHQNIVPYQVFEVANTPSGERDFIILAVGNDRQFAKFCEVANRDWHKDPKYILNQDRVKNRASLVPELEACLKTRSKQSWLTALESAKVPCGAINNFAEVFSDPQVRHRNMVRSWDHPLKKGIELVSNPIKLSKTPVQKRNPPPMLGEHTHQVLKELLHLSDKEIESLKESKVL